MDAVTAGESGSFAIGPGLEVNRLGFGSMQLTGRNGFGPSRDAVEAVAVLRRAVERGVTLIDTADAYGPSVAEELIAEALSPYPSDLVIATKGGYVRDDRATWITDGRPEHLRDAIEGSLRRLRLDRIDLYQLHRVDRKVPLADQVGTLRELRDEGKIANAGLSQVSVAQLEEARSIIPIATVQNLFNVTDRSSADVVRYAERHGIGFIPWFPLATGGLIDQPVLQSIADAHGATTSQVALAWLLQHSKTMLPIPGTSSRAHLDQNIDAARLHLQEAEIARIDLMTAP